MNNKPSNQVLLKVWVLEVSLREARLLQPSLEGIDLMGQDSIFLLFLSRTLLFLTLLLLFLTPTLDLLSPCRRVSPRVSFLTLGDGFIIIRGILPLDNRRQSLQVKVVMD